MLLLVGFILHSRVYRMSLEAGLPAAANKISDCFPECYDGESTGEIYGWREKGNEPKGKSISGCEGTYGVSPVGKLLLTILTAHPFSKVHVVVVDNDDSKRQCVRRGKFVYTRIHLSVCRARWNSEDSSRSAEAGAQCIVVLKMRKRLAVSSSNKTVTLPFRCIYFSFSM